MLSIAHARQHPQHQLNVSIIFLVQFVPDVIALHRSHHGLLIVGVVVALSRDEILQCNRTVGQKSIFMKSWKLTVIP